MSGGEKASPSGTKGVLSCVRFLLSSTLRLSPTHVSHLMWRGLSSIRTVLCLSVTTRSSLRLRMHLLARLWLLVIASCVTSLISIVTRSCFMVLTLSHSLRLPLILPLSLTVTTPARLCVPTMPDLITLCLMITLTCTMVQISLAQMLRLWTLWLWHSLPFVTLTSMCVGAWLTVAWLTRATQRLTPKLCMLISCRIRITPKRITRCRIARLKPRFILRHASVSRSTTSSLHGLCLAARNGTRYKATSNGVGRGKTRPILLCKS